MGVAPTWLHGRGMAWRGRGRAWRGRSMVGPAHLFLELHADGVGLLEEDGIAPQQVPQRCELVPLPLPEGPLGQLKFMLCPRN